VEETEAGIDKPGDFVDQRCAHVQQRSSKSWAEHSSSAAAISAFRTGGLSKRVTVSRGVPQNSD
jgi:hypothetical protein